MSIKFLKVKIKSLAEESKIIRKEEKRAKDQVRDSLYLHRVIEVRDEARRAHLAYAYARGKKAPAFLKRPSDEDRVLKLLQKYAGIKITREQLINWVVDSFQSSAGSLENAPAFNLAS